MKKMIIAAILVGATFAASAVEVGVSAVRDGTADKNGARVTASVGSIAGFTPQLSATHIDGVYTRYGIGGQYALTKVGPVALAATASVVYQDSNAKANGYGVTAGLKATLPLTKRIDLVAGVERFAGQHSIVGSNSTVSSLGLNVKF